MQLARARVKQDEAKKGQKGRHKLTVFDRMKAPQVLQMHPVATDTAQEQAARERERGEPYDDEVEKGQHPGDAAEYQRLRKSGQDKASPSKKNKRQVTQDRPSASDSDDST